MRKMLMVALCVLVFAGLALAQNPPAPYNGGQIQNGATAAGNSGRTGVSYSANTTNGNFDTTNFTVNGNKPSWWGSVDKLGPHQNGGKGCVGCHAPHSGNAGNGGNPNNTYDATAKTWSSPIDTTHSGNDVLWGQDLGPLYNATLEGQTYTQWIPGGIDTQKYTDPSVKTGPITNNNYNTWQYVDGLGNKLYTGGSVAMNAGGPPTQGNPMYVFDTNTQKWTTTPLFTTTLFTAGGYSLPGVNQFDTRKGEVTGIMMCLSCHDGNIAQGAMMTNQSYEQKYGLLPQGANGMALYGPQTIPTLLGNDGTTAGNYENDHPIGPDANLGAVGVANNFTFVAGGCARGTVDCLKVKTSADAAAYQAFVAHYGAPNIVSNGHGSPVVIVDNAPQKSFLVCTTCHTPHAMYTYKANSDAPIAGKTSDVFPTFFFIAAPYNPGSNPGVSQASSATQFCRQCHFTGAGGSNEGNGIMGVTTAF